MLRFFFCRHNNKAPAFQFPDLIAIDNPVRADDDGNYTFTIDDGVYDLYIDYGLPTQTAILNEQIANTVDLTVTNREVPRTLSDGQLVVNFDDIPVVSASISIGKRSGDGRVLRVGDDYDVTGDYEITLKESYNAGTICFAVTSDAVNSSDKFVKEYKTLEGSSSSAVNIKDQSNIFSGSTIRVTERSSGSGGGGSWNIVEASSAPPIDGYSVVPHSTLPLVFVLVYSDDVCTEQLGSTLDNSLVQAAIDLGVSNVYVGPGEWVYSSPIILRNDLKLTFSPESMTTPAIDSISLIETPAGSFTDISPVNTENCTVHGFRFKMDGRANCHGAKVGNFRDNTGFFNCFGANDLNLVGPMDDRNNVGIELNILCWNTDLQNCYMRSGLNKSYSIRNGSNAVVIMNCKSNTATTGIFISNGTFATENTNIVGGYYQRAVVNIDDRADHTVYNGPYLERPSVADINMDEAQFPVITSAHFTGGEDAPSVGIMARNVRGASIRGVLNTASRTNGLFDFDATNEYCFASNQRSDSRH